MRTVKPSRLLTGVLAAVLLAGAIPANAEAGTYTVTATCGNWDAVNDEPARFAVYAACPLLTARNIQADFRTGPGIGGGWVFSTPPGTSIDGIRLSGAMVGDRELAVHDLRPGRPVEAAPRSSTARERVARGTTFFDWKAHGVGGAQAIIARVRCGSTGGCSNAEVRGGIQLWNSYITIVDPLPPAASAAGALASSGWKSGTVPVTVAVDDNVGVKQTRALIDGVPRAVTSRSCNYAFKTPCPNGADSLAVSLSGLDDGSHALTVQAR